MDNSKTDTAFQIVFPSFPGKTLFKKTYKDREFVEQRRQMLEKYLQMIAKEEIIRSTPLFRSFLTDRRKVKKILFKETKLMFFFWN